MLDSVKEGVPVTTADMLAAGCLDWLVDPLPEEVWDDNVAVSIVRLRLAEFDVEDAGVGDGDREHVTSISSHPPSPSESVSLLLLSAKFTFALKRKCMRLLV